jgi:hypothetical protein
MKRRTVQPKSRRAAKKDTITITAPQTAPTGTYLCLDVSSRTVGWAVMTNQRLLRYGKFQPAPKGDHGEKLGDFLDWLIEQLADVDGLVVEVPYPGPKRNAYGVLRMYFAVVCMAYWARFGCELPEQSRIGPRAVKRVLGLGKQDTYEARKAQMVAWVNQHYGLSLVYKANDDGRVSDADIADAIGLGHAFFATAGG